MSLLHFQIIACWFTKHNRSTTKNVRRRGVQCAQVERCKHFHLIMGVNSSFDVRRTHSWIAKWSFLRLSLLYFPSVTLQRRIWSPEIECARNYVNKTECPLCKWKERCQISLEHQINVQINTLPSVSHRCHWEGVYCCASNRQFLPLSVISWKNQSHKTNQNRKYWNLFIRSSHVSSHEISKALPLYSQSIYTKRNKKMEIQFTSEHPFSVFLGIVVYWRRMKTK